MWIGGIVSTLVSSMHACSLGYRSCIAQPVYIVHTGGTCDPLWDSLTHFTVCVRQVLVAFSLPQ